MVNILYGRILVSGFWWAVFGEEIWWADLYGGLWVAVLGGYITLYT